MDLENHSCGHIFCTFKANLIKLHVFLPIRLNRKLKVISRTTCRVKKQFARPNFSYIDGHIQHLVHGFSGEQSRAIMAILYILVLGNSSFFGRYVLGCQVFSASLRMVFQLYFLLVQLPVFVYFLTRRYPSISMRDLLISFG